MGGFLAGVGKAVGRHYKDRLAKKLGRGSTPSGSPESSGGEDGRGVGDIAKRIVEQRKSQKRSTGKSR